MKKFATKMIALGLCALLAANGTAMNTFAADSDESKTEKQEEPEKEFPAENVGISKDETVYVLAGADGSAQKIIVSDWIQNPSGEASLKDQSELTDIENVKGEETFTNDGGALVWDAQGNDIYYQGNTEKELPVDLSVTYKLDGAPILAEDLAGKSGKVTIRFDYENKQYETVEIDGKEEKIYVPFAMLTGVLLDDDVFRNIEISNGKLINDGSRTAAIGIAFPGLQDDLAISRDKLEIPDYVEITADATDFQLDMTVTLATNALWKELDVDGSDSVSELSDSMGELTDAMDQLLDGSSQLYDGLATLLEKSDELADGVDQLADGAESLKGGAEDLDTGAGSLQSGAEQLKEGLSTLVSNNDSLNGGAKQVFDTLLSTANTQLTAAGLDVPALTIENYEQVLNGVIESLSEDTVYEQALGQVTAAVEAQRDTIAQQVTAAVAEEVTAQVTAAVKEEVTAQVTQAVREAVAGQVVSSLPTPSGEPLESYEMYQAAVEAGQIDPESQEQIEAAIEQQMQSEAVLDQIQSETDNQMESQTIQDTIATKTDAQMRSDAINQTVAEQTEQQIQKIAEEKMGSDEVQAQLAAAAEGARSVTDLKTSLDSYNTFYLGLQSYTAGVDEAATGAETLKAGTDELKAGTSQLSDGASELYEGVLALKDGTPALIDGITQLRDGAMQLSDGLKEFDEQGIQKLVDAVDGDLKGLADRFDAMRDVSLRYKNFAGADEDMDGQVTFIYRTDSTDPME